MPTTPALFETMAQQVAQQCDQRRSEANREAERIRAEGRGTADQRYESGLAVVKAELDAADRRVRHQVAVEAEKSKLAAQHQVVEEVLAQVKQEIGRMASSADFGSILEALLEEILGVVSGQGLVVLSPPAHVDRLRQRLAETGRDGVAVVAYPALTDGVAVQDERRSYRISNTLSGRLNVVSNDARKLCQNRLFGG